MTAASTTKFKETEIGLIPEEWEILSLTELADVIGGGTPKTQEPSYWNGNIPWLSVVDFNNDSKKVYVTEKSITDEGLRNSSTKVLKRGSLVISARGTVGALTQLGVDMAFNQSCYGLVAKSISSDLLYYLVKSTVADIQKKTHGSVFDTITRETLDDIKLGLPKNVEEQKQIAEILSSLDDRIELNRQINTNLEKLASSLFKKWFVDTDDELPEGWRMGKISDFIKVESGFPFNSSMFDEYGQYKLVTIKNVQDGHFIYECTDSLSVIPDKMPSHCKLKDGDILLSLTGNVGRVCIVSGENYLLNQRVAILNPIYEKNRAFTYLLFRQKDFQNTLMVISRGTAQQNLSPIETKNIEIVIPAEDTLDRFAKVANPIFEIIIDNLKQISNLSALRDSLLPRLMSGKIRTK